MISGLDMMMRRLSNRKKPGQTTSVLVEPWLGVSTSTQALEGKIAFGPVDLSVQFTDLLQVA